MKQLQTKLEDEMARTIAEMTDAQKIAGVNAPYVNQLMGYLDGLRWASELISEDEE